MVLLIATEFDVKMQVATSEVNAAHGLHFCVPTGFGCENADNHAGQLFLRPPLELLLLLPWGHYPVAHLLDLWLYLSAICL